MTSKQNKKGCCLKKLDKKAKQPALIFAYTFGVISSLILGTGMYLAMKVIGGSNAMMAVGVVNDLIGILGCTVNYHQD